MATVSDTSKNKNITLYQLATSLEKVQTYVDGKDSALSSRIDGKSDSGHKHASSDITSMGGYAKASEAAAIATTDSLNVAIGKIEKALDGKSNEGHNHNSSYYTKTQIDTTLNSYVTSSSLTTTLGSYAKKSDLHSHDNKTVLDGITSTKVSSWDSAEANAKSYTDTKVAGLVDSAPELLNTLDELAAAIGDDPNFAATMATQIGKKVDAVSGKGLSTNDFTNDYKTKLEGIKSGAEVNQNAFSNVAVGDVTIAADAKTDTLTLEAGSNITLTPDATYDKITIAAKDTTYGDATTSKAGLMTAAMVTKLNGIATGANAYTHPSNYTAYTGTPSANATLTHGGTFTVNQVSNDNNGHVTAITSRTYTLPSETSLSKGTDATATGSLSHSGTFTAITGFSVSGHEITPTVTTYTLPSDNDKKVEQKAAITTAGEYPVILAYSTATSAQTNYVNKASTLTYNPNTKVLSTTTFKGALDGNAATATSATTAASCTGNAATATKATQDSAGQQINTTYIKGLSVSGKTITYTKGDGTTGTITTQDTNTTYNAATQSANGLMSSTDKTKLDGIASGAQVNQNAFSNVVVGDTTVAADTTTDSLTLVAGSNVTITADAEADSITIAAKDTTYSDASTSAKGLMTAAMVTKLNGIAEGANAYTHPSDGKNTGSFGNSSNQTPGYGSTFNVPYITVNSAGHVTAISNKTVKIPASDNTDTKVTNTLATTTKAYITGTTSTTTNTGTQVFDTGVYLDTTAGHLTATQFNGALNGNASSATTAAACTGNAATATTASSADKTKASLTLQFNGTTSKTFNGSSAQTFNVTCAAIGAATTADAEKATDTEVATMLTSIFG